MTETTVREFIAILTEAAAGLTAGLDTPLDLAICDGSNMQMIDEVDVSPYFMVKRDMSPDPARREWVTIRGHWHPDQSPGEVRRGMESDLDSELRDLTGDDE